MMSDQLWLVPSRFWSVETTREAGFSCSQGVCRGPWEDEDMVSQQHVRKWRQRGSSISPQSVAAMKAMRREGEAVRIKMKLKMKMMYCWEPQAGIYCLPNSSGINR